jgi:hypothetical protein
MVKRGKIQEIADECGVDHRTVRRSLERAELKAGRGGYDFDAAVAAVNAIADPARVNGHAVTRGNAGNGGAMLDARTRHEELKARRLEIENQKAEGELISRAAVTETVTRVLADLRVALLAAGIRLASNVEGLTDEKAIARLIEDELRETLVTFANPDKILTEIEDEALT